MKQALLTGFLGAAVFLGFFAPAFILVSRGLAQQAEVASVAVSQPLATPQSAAQFVPPASIAASSTSVSDTSTTIAAPGTLVMGGEVFTADISNTAASRQQGLSGRTNLGNHEVMLFVFPTAGQWGFWMKDMNFPLDIIWLDASGNVIYLKPNLSASTYPTVYAPQTGAAKYVIEANAGTAAAIGLQLGSVVTLPVGLTAQ